MEDFALRDTVEYIRRIVPFDALSDEELAELAAQVEIDYYPRGEVIIKRGGELPRFLYIIKRGSVWITIADEYYGREVPVDVRGEGDVFGAVSLLQGKQALFDVTVEEDLIAYLLPSELFAQLVESHPEFKRYFSFSLARAIGSMREGEDIPLPHIGPVSTLNLDMFLTRKRVSDLMVTNVLTCSSRSTIRAAAQRMAQRGVNSILIEGDGNFPVGIISDKDLRTKVLAADRSVDEAVADIMSRPLLTIQPQACLFDALLTMSRHGVSHLPVIENDRLVGIISDHELRVETGSSPVSVIGDIERAQSIDELISLRPKIDLVLEMLLQQGGSIKRAMELLVELNDRATLRLIKFTELEIAEEGFGQPPVPYSWMSLGSEGRREQTLRTDQDNALVFANVSPKDEGDIKQWFLMFSERVVAGLVRYGFPRCPGGIMASNPQWCQSEDQWLKTFLDWVNHPDPLPLRMASIFFDFRALYAGTDFLDMLRKELNEAIKQNPLFLRFMAKNSLYNRPPLGLLRRFVIEKSGEHKNELNLKLRGIIPVVDSVRIMALELNVRNTNTLERLEQVHERRILDQELYSDLREAYAFIKYLRLSRHLQARSRSEEPDNFVNPENLNSLERKMLKESFGVINRLQDLIAFRYQTQYITEI